VTAVACQVNSPNAISVLLVPLSLCAFGLRSAVDRDRSASPSGASSSFTAAMQRGVAKFQRWPSK